MIFWAISYYWVYKKNGFKIDYFPIYLFRFSSKRLFPTLTSLYRSSSIKEVIISKENGQDHLKFADQLNDKIHENNIQ